MNAKDLVFWKKGSFPTKLTDDIAVSVHKDGCISLSISPEAFFFLGKPEYLTVAHHGHRLYLKATDASYGIKAQKINGGSRRYLRFPPAVLSAHMSVKAITGAYKLKMDMECGLPYIEWA